MRAFIGMMMLLSNAGQAQSIDDAGIAKAAGTEQNLETRLDAIWWWEALYHLFEFLFAHEKIFDFKTLSR